MTTMAKPSAGPSYPDIRRRVADLMTARGEWAGAPVPIEGLSLCVEPSYPYQGLNERIPDRDEKPEENSLGLDANGLLPGEAFVNSWYSRRRQAHVMVVRNADGRGIVFELPERSYNRRLSISLKSCKAAWAHDVAAEKVAMHTLSQHVSEYQMQQFTLLGHFIETSKRSRVTYVFRRARPTVAMRPTLDGIDIRVLAVLCMHPIGYYRETTVGAMTPTDDVLAHLLLMRGDEPMLWRRCNQHQPDDPEAML